jgi:uridine kinase
MYSGDHRAADRQLRLHSIDDLFDRAQRLVNAAPETTSLILIGGCSRSGKSTLAHAVASRFTASGISTRVLGLDHWLIDVEHRSAASTVLERYDGNAIVQAVMALLCGETVHPPVYDVVTRRRVAERSEEGVCLATGVLIVEGVVALALEELLRSARARIYTHTDDDVRLARLRDFYTRTKRLGADEAESLIEARELEEVPSIKQTVAHADFVFAS